MPGPAPPLLMIAHGTREPRGETEMGALVGLVADRTGGPVAHAWLEEYAEPAPLDAAARLIADGAEELVTLPLLLLGAGHAKTDVPEQVAAIRQGFPQLTVSHGRVLGLHPALLTLAARRVRSAGEPADALLVTTSGSSDPDANGDLAKAARLLAELTGHRWAETAYAGVTWPRTDDVLRRLHAAGAGRVTRFSWSLLAGRLERRVAGHAGEVSAETGIEVVDAGRFGPDALVADAVVERYHEALGGDVRMNCDLCAYRVPLPGFTDRVAAPSAGGTGTRIRKS